MLKTRFAKYARAVNDECERLALYKKYVAKIIATTIFLLLSIFLVCILAVLQYSLDSMLIYIITALFFIWVICGVVVIYLWISFRNMYTKILSRPAFSSEIPEVTSYRQKVVSDKKATFKKLRWVWVIFGICVVLFITLLTIETINNPESDDMGMLGFIGTMFLLAGVLTLFFAYITNAILKQQNGKAIEQQTALEVEKIDRVQGRNSTYNIRSDMNIQIDKMYTYLFPNKTLYERAQVERKKRTKIITPIVIILFIVGIVELIIFLYFGLIGYPLPVMLAIIFGGIKLLSIFTDGKLKEIESEQKREFESKTEYAKHLEWYNLNYNFKKLNNRIYFICIVIAIVSGFVLAILFPYDAWSLLSLAPIIIVGIVNNKSVKILRQKSIPIENEIDRQNDIH